MKLKELKNKDAGEIKAMLKDAEKELPKLRMELAMHKDKNVKKLANKKREVAVLSGLLSAKSGEAK